MNEKRIRFVGGSQDGHEMPDTEDVKVGAEFRFPAIRGQVFTEVYEMESDGALHFRGYSERPPAASNPDDLKLEQDADLMEVAKRLDEVLKDLTALCEKRGAFLPSISFEGWQVRRMVR